MIDKRYRGIGRIRKASGTFDKDVHRDTITMLDQLYATGKHKVLREIQTGAIKPAIAHGLWLEGKLDTAVSTVQFRSLRQEVDTYLDDSQLAADTLRVYRNLLQTFDAKYPNRQLEQLPDCLEDLRKDVIKRNHRKRAFNLTRSLFQGFLSNTKGVGRFHPLWIAVTSVKPVAVKAEKVLPLSVAEYLSLRSRFGSKPFQEMLDTLLFTGMRKGEYYRNKYTIEEDRVLIHGTKRAASERMVPRWLTPTPSGREQTFEKQLRDLGQELFKRRLFPHALRHTFAHWLELADLPATRRDLYMGHAGQGIRATYTYNEVAGFLAADHDTFQKWYKAELAKVGRKPNRAKRQTSLPKEKKPARRRPQR